MSEPSSVPTSKSSDDTPKSLAQMKHEELLHIHGQLRDEILHNADATLQLLNISLIATGALATAAVTIMVDQDGNLNRDSFLAAGIVFYIAFAFNVILMRLTFGPHRTTLAIARFLRDRVETHLVVDTKWETYIDHLRRQNAARPHEKRKFFLEHLGIFLSIAFFSYLAGSYLLLDSQKMAFHTTILVMGIVLYIGVAITYRFYRHYKHEWEVYFTRLKAPEEELMTETDEISQVKDSVSYYDLIHWFHTKCHDLRSSVLHWVSISLTVDLFILCVVVLLFGPLCSEFPDYTIPQILSIITLIVVACCLTVVSICYGICAFSDWHKQTEMLQDGASMSPKVENFDVTMTKMIDMLAFLSKFEARDEGLDAQKRYIRHSFANQISFPRSVYNAIVSAESCRKSYERMTLSRHLSFLSSVPTVATILILYLAS